MNTVSWGDLTIGGHCSIRPSVALAILAILARVVLVSQVYYCPERSQGSTPRLTAQDEPLSPPGDRPQVGGRRAAGAEARSRAVSACERVRLPGCFRRPHGVGGSLAPRLASRVRTPVRF